MTLEIAVVGANGFIGRRVVQALQRDPTFDVTGLVRRQVGPGSRTFDLRDRCSIDASLSSPSAIVHAASYVGRDPETAHEVNIQGTANLVAAAREHGVHRFVYVSTAAVYGRGPFHGVKEHDSVISPASDLSRSRAAAERIVLDAGGIVVRPHLVLGDGDRWVAPTIRNLTLKLGAQIDHGTAQHSWIRVTELGVVVAALATMAEIDPGPYHAASPAPITAADLVNAAFEGVVTQPPASSIPLHTALLRLSSLPTLRSAAQLLGVDHAFDGSKLRTALQSAAVRASPQESGASWK
jgi:nucleoside-diphosphate-sugar epimerase